jgi:hypothetical protein
MACPFCAIMLKGARASANATVEMTDLMSYVAGALPATPVAQSGPAPGATAPSS